MTAPLILDLSHHNTVRDLHFAAAAGIGAAIVKVTQGLGGHDQMYAPHAAKVKEAGLRLGAYHFGSGAASGAAQAQYFLKMLVADGGIPQVLALDVENNPGGVTMNLPQAEEFVNTVRAAHPISTVIVYGGSLLREMRIPSTSCLATCPLWIAAYTSGVPKTIPPWTSWMLWQYTDKQGAIPDAPDTLDGYDLTTTHDGLATLQHLWNES
jgi:lysozyme